MKALKSLPTFNDHKSRIDFMNSLCIVNNSYAQNVLDLYVIYTVVRDISKFLDKTQKSLSSEKSKTKLQTFFHVINL
jgi:hypothetical protein